METTRAKVLEHLRNKQAREAKGKPAGRRVGELSREVCLRAEEKNV